MRCNLLTEQPAGYTQDHLFVRRAAETTGTLYLLGRKEFTRGIEMICYQFTQAYDFTGRDTAFDVLVMIHILHSKPIKIVFRYDTFDGLRNGRQAFSCAILGRCFH